MVRWLRSEGLLLVYSINELMHRVLYIRYCNKAESADPSGGHCYWDWRTSYWEQKPRDSNDRLASVLQHTGRPTKRADRTT
jgi:hypothetical protein